MKVARVGVEERHLAGGGLHHARMRVAHVRDVVDAIQVGAACRVVKMLLPTANDVQRMLVRKTERRAKRVAARGGQRTGGSRAGREAAGAAEYLVGPIDRKRHV